MKLVIVYYLWKFLENIQSKKLFVFTWAFIKLAFLSQEMFDLCLTLFWDTGKKSKNFVTVFCEQYMFDSRHHASSERKVIRFL